MFAALKRHPVPIEAFFDYSLVLAYAFPEEVLQPLLPPGLTVDAYDGLGFLAIALVQTRDLRPKGFPRAFGRDFFLSGYRIFARRKQPSGKILRGLRILRSDTDSSVMAFGGNLLTHYNYRVARVESRREEKRLSLSIRTPGGEADLRVTADLGAEPPLPPAGSPFKDWAEARKFSGPLPFTFDYEKLTHSLVIIEGVRENWRPRPVAATVEEASFFTRPPFDGVKPVLANAFYIESIPYHWRPGVLEPL